MGDMSLGEYAWEIMAYMMPKTTSHVREDFPYIAIG